MNRQFGQIFLLALASVSSFGMLFPRAVRAEPRGEEIADLARIFGFVTDPQGAIVSRASVTLMNSTSEAHQQRASDRQGYFEFDSVEPGKYRLTATASGFVDVTTDITVDPGEAVHADIKFIKLSGQAQQLTVIATSPDILTPDPGQKILIHDDVLDANPGRPGAPISIPGLPIETASGGIKAPQYFAPGVAGDHGEPIAQYYRLGDYLYPNNLPANAHGNGYSDPNFLISQGIGAVEVSAGAFNVREGNHSVDLAVSYGPRERLLSFVQLTGDYRDIDLVAGWSPVNPKTNGWTAVEASFGNGFLARLEHRQQYKVNGYRVFRAGNQEITLFGIGYYGFSYVPGLIPIGVPVSGDTIDPRQRDFTHTTLGILTDTWKVSDKQSLIFSGFFRTYSLALRSNFGDGLIQQSEFRTVAGGNASYLYKILPKMTFLAGVDLRRDAPRNLDLRRADENGVFQLVTSNNLTLGFAEPFVLLDGNLTRYFHYDLGVCREEVSMDNLDKIDPANSFNKWQGITLPKGTVTINPPLDKYPPSVAFSYGEAFHINDPRIGNGSSSSPTVLVPSRAYQLVLTKPIPGVELKVALTRVTNAEELAKINPDTGLQQDVGPSINRAITVSARHQFSFGYFQASWAQADSRDLLTGAPIPEAPRMIWDAVGAFNRLPYHLQARGEFEYVGAKPLGDGFIGVPVREIRGALVCSFGDGRMNVGIDFLLASGYTGQTTETLQLAGESTPFERSVGVPLKSYASLTWTYNFHH
jgi:hypothetical protein